MNQSNHKLILFGIANLAFGIFSGVCGTFILTSDVGKWREFDNDTKYTYERISPDSVILTVCSTNTIHYKDPNERP